MQSAQIVTLSEPRPQDSRDFHKLSGPNIRKGNKMTLKEAWEKKSKLWAEGDKLWAEGDKLWAEADKLWAEGNKLKTEGRKLWAEGDKLRAEGDLIYINTVIELHGPKAEINWDDGTVIVKVRP